MGNKNTDKHRQRALDTHCKLLPQQIPRRPTRQAHPTNLHYECRNEIAPQDLQTHAKRMERTNGKPNNTGRQHRGNFKRTHILQHLHENKTNANRPYPTTTKTEDRNKKKRHKNNSRHMLSLCKRFPNSNSTKHH